MRRIFCLSVLFVYLLLPACSKSEDATAVPTADSAPGQPNNRISENPAVKFVSLTSMPAGAYALDASHGYINFGYSHLGYSTPHVGFKTFQVELDLDPNALARSLLQVTIDAASVDSRVEEFDGHLRGEDFFDTDSYPTIRFEATNFTPTSTNTFDVLGNLTIKDVSNPLTLNVTINKAGSHPMSGTPTIGLSASAKVKRSNWNLESALPYVSDDVTLRIEAELVQK